MALLSEATQPNRMLMDQMVAVSLAEKIPPGGEMRALTPPERGF